MTFGEFQVFITYFRSMNKNGNSVAKAKFTIAQHESSFITCTIMEAHQNYHGYIVKVNAKTETYGW